MSASCANSILFLSLSSAVNLHFINTIFNENIHNTKHPLNSRILPYETEPKTQM